MMEGDFSKKGYRSAADHVKDVAALVILFPCEVKKKLAGKGKPAIIDSLRHATRPVLLEYLMNGSRFAARNANVKIMAGTTRNEAYHQQMKYMFRNVMHQTGRNAQNVSAVATLAKLMVSYISREWPLTVKHREHMLLLRAASMLMEKPLTFVPLLDHRAMHNPKVDMDNLPPNAKTIRKRPASMIRQRVLKRPANITNQPMLKRPCRQQR